MGKMIHEINEWMLELMPTIAWFFLVQWVIALIYLFKSYLKVDDLQKENKGLKVRIFDFEVMGKEYYDRHYKNNGDKQKSNSN